MKIRSCQPRFQGNFRRLSAGAVAFDAMGRPVLNQKSSHYFVGAVSGWLSAAGCHKVVIQR